MADTKVSLKLLVDTKSNKVLFAEAGKEFVDFLFRIMSLPIGIVAKLANATDMSGCLGELYRRIESLEADYMLRNVTKESVMNPRARNASAGHERSRNFYCCSANTSPTDHSTIGYVKRLVTYIVMDHLEVKPMSSISSISVINELGVKDFSSLVEKHVQVTLNEAVAILKASLETRAVLTTAFLGNTSLNRPGKRKFGLSCSISCFFG